MELNQIIDGIQERANDASPIGNTMKLMLDDDCIFIDGTGDSNVVSSENKDADCTVTITKDNFKALVKGELNPMTAFMMGKVKVSGDMSVAMKLQSFLG